MGLFSLIFRLGTDNRELNSGLQDATLKARIAAKMMGDSFKSNISGALSGAFAGALSLGAISAVTKKTIDFASNIKDLSDRTGVGVENLQALDFALKQTGASLEDGVTAMRALGQARADALKDPFGSKADAFRQFGISIDALRDIRDPSELMLRLSDAVKATNLDLNSTPRLLELIGNRGQAVIPALAAGLRDAFTNARSLGVVLGENLINAADDLGDRLDELKTKFDRTFGGFLVARLVDALDGIQEFQGGLGNVLGTLWADPLTVWKDGTFETFMKGAEMEADLIEDEAVRKKVKRALALKKQLDAIFNQPSPPGEGPPQPRGQPVSPKDVQAEIDNINRQRDMLFMDPRAQRDLIQKELDDLKAQVEKRPAFLPGGGVGIFDNPNPDQRMAIARKELELAQMDLRLGNMRDMIRPNQGDQLSAVGNFLGTTGPSRAENQLDRANKLLERIEQHTMKMTRDGRIVLE